MKKNISNSILSLLFISVLFSCKAKKEIVRPGVPASAEVVNIVKAKRLTQIKNNVSKYSTLSIRAKTDLEIDNSSNDVTMNIRIDHERAIWVSVTAIAGLEVARALITPDSVKIMNKLEGTYLKKPFSYLYEYASNQINFNTLEDIFAGNPVKETVTEKSNLSIKGKQPVLSGMLESLAYQIMFNEKDKVVQTILKDERALQSLVISYGDFIKVQDQDFPHLVNIRSRADRKSIVIDLKYNRVALNETLDMPFSVPRRFTLID